MPLQFFKIQDVTTQLYYN